MCNLDVIPLQIVATSSFHPANGGSLSANHIYGPGHLPATNTNIHIQLHEGVHTFLCFSTLYSRCIHNTHTSVGLGLVSDSCQATSGIIIVLLIYYYSIY